MDSKNPPNLGSVGLVMEKWERRLVPKKATKRQQQKITKTTYCAWLQSVHFINWQAGTQNHHQMQHDSRQWSWYIWGIWGCGFGTWLLHNHMQPYVTCLGLGHEQFAADISPIDSKCHFPIVGWHLVWNCNLSGTSSISSKLSTQNSYVLPATKAHLSHHPWPKCPEHGPSSAEQLRASVLLLRDASPDRFLSLKT